jgi:hypothetical protein
LVKVENNDAIKIHSALQCNAVKIKYKDAIKDERLRESMVKELRSMFKVGCCEIVDLPPDRVAIGNTWAHKLKHGPNGEFIRAKSRVCPWGFQEIPGIDYDPNGVASPTLSIETAMLVLAITVFRVMFAILIDVDGAFQTTPNKFETYMKFPEGMKKIPGKALLLLNSMNGTKQGAYDWHEKADELLLLLLFKSTTVDPCLYYRWDGEILTLVALYVDDFRCVSDSSEKLDEIVTCFKKHYAIKVQSADWWLGMKIIHDKENHNTLLQHRTQSC